MRKQTAILLPLLTWCSASDTRKTDLSAVCESNQLVKSFFFFFQYVIFFSWPLVLVATRPYFCECSAHDVLFIDVC
uniref:Secreted protein n=1 Tax=Rhipicephalus microplus TaxID=6941 RepID=A0A6M2DCN0_RHIMP